MQQMILFLQDTDRANRKKAFETSLKRWQDDAEELDEIFNKLLKIRIQIAKNAGYDDYIAYKFKSLGRFDYTPAQCLEFHEAIEKVVVPICRKAMEDRRKDMNIDQLFPWDVNTDPMGRDPLRPFEDIEQLVNGCLEIFNRVDSELGANFKHMIDLGLLDLSSRRGKAPGGFQITLSEVKLPFIFMNAVGTNRDLFTLLHEGGHAFHTFAARNQPIIDYRPAPMEFSEVASMAMENLSREHLDVFYNDADAARAQYEHLAKNIFLLPWIATVDAFQHWMYSNPDHTNAERDKYWIELMQKYNDGINYTGYEHALKYRWHAQIHIFERPFYYIEYGIALLGALQIWRNSKIDKKATIQNYKNALSKGGSVSIPELFESAGIRFEFSADTIRPLMNLVGTEMKRLRELEIG
jgi:oligoendopeptidase F